MRFSLREIFIWKTTIFSLFIFLSTEFFSFFNIINYFSIKLFWFSVLIILTILLLTKKKIVKKYFIININKILNYKIFFIILLFFLTLLIALIYPPNTLDAMSYHMTRVMHWIQNENINFYPTNDFRELVMGPFPEYVIMHLYLLTNGDYFSNLVQWYSMITCCCAVSLISKEFGCNQKFQLFSALFSATIPMGILQSTSTQTDYVATMWIIILAYSTVRFINTNYIRYIFLFSISLGLGILSKGTVYIFGLSFCIWLGLFILLKKRDHFKYLFLISLIVFSLNFSHFYRNFNLTDNLFGLNEESNIWTNKILNISSLTSNLIRNTALNIAVPNEYINLNIIKKSVDFFHVYLNISTNDKRTSVSSFYIPFSFYESSAPNTFHLIIFITSILLLLSKKKFSRNAKYYFFSLIIGYVLFSLIMKWDMRNNRLLLTFFVLSSTIVAYSLYQLKLKKFTNTITILLIIYSIPYIFFNKSRPLIAELEFDRKYIFGKPFFLTQEREQLYYVAETFFRNGDLYKNHAFIANQISIANCGVIGFYDKAYSDMQYPLWVLIKKKINNVIIININVKNKSSFLNNEKFKDKKICAIVEFNDNIKLNLI